MINNSAPEYVNADRRGRNPALEVITERQILIEKRTARIEEQVTRNTVVIEQMRELLQAPATFWAWCEKWGRRISIFAKYAAPIAALGIAVNHFFHIDLWELLLKLFSRK